jgi:hypothetical protein
MVIYSIWPDIRVFSVPVSGIRPDIRHVKSCIRLNTGTGYKKGGIIRPDIRRIPSSKYGLDCTSVVDLNSFFSDSDPQIIFFGFGFGFLD